MKNLIRYFISPIIFLVFYILAEYLIRGSIDLKMTIISTIMYAILNMIFHMLFGKKLDKIHQTD